MIKNIVFDMGGVIIRFDRHLFISRFDVSPEDEKLLETELFTSIEWAQMDRGSITEKEAEQSICARLPGRLHDVAHKLITMWDRPILPVDGMEDLIRELHENGYKIYLLSNASVRQPEYWARVPAARYFDDTLVSAAIRLVKPQPEIYVCAYNRFNIWPEESVFIDDNPWNCEASQCTGMRAFVFHNDAGAVRRFLRSLGVRVNA